MLDYVIIESSGHETVTVSIIIPPHTHITKIQSLFISVDISIKLRYENYFFQLLLQNLKPCIKDFILNYPYFAAWSLCYQYRGSQPAHLCIQKLPFM